ncbi:MAG TPA: FtsX-like permease family protein [Vicinamibacterales bacterium]|nr:FtsX-like permease family protein [Vicinamibacterales bacterium]
MVLAPRDRLLFLKDLQYSARTLARSPGVALALVLTIALGIGSNAAVHGFVRGLMSRDLPLPAADTVVSVFAWDGTRQPGPVSHEEFLSLRTRRDIFEQLGAARESEAQVVVADVWSVMSVAAISPELADILQLPAGRGVVVSHRLWQTQLGAATDVRRHSIRLDDVETPVTGVAPEWLEGLYLGRPIDIWMPLPEEEAASAIDRNGRYLWILGRLGADVSVDRAQAGIGAGRPRDHAMIVLRYSGMTPELDAGLSRISALLRVAAAAVLLIACANVASFLMARATARSHETSIRLALGAGRGHLVRHVLSESVLVSVVGGTAGLLLSVWTAQIVPALFFEQDAEHLVFSPDRRGIAIVSAACVGLTIVCGLLPLVQIRHDHPAAVLQRESAGPSRALSRVRAGLVASQMTWCCVLVIFTGLLLQGFRTALRTSVADRLGKTLLVTVEARTNSSSVHERSALALQYLHDVESAARSVSDASASLWTATPPASLPSWQFVRIEAPQSDARDVGIDVAVFTSQSTAHITLPPVAGRMFSGEDTTSACTVVVVNEQAAGELFGEESVGRSIEAPTGDRLQIVGVVATREPEHGHAPPRPTMYYYGDQTGPLKDRLGPARFHIPARTKLPIVGLDADVVSPGYFATMGLVPIAGTVFGDGPSRGCRVGVINQEAAERYFGGNAVGAAVIDATGRRTEIIGVVRSAPLKSTQRRVEPAIYFPIAQDVRPRMTLVLSAADTSREAIAALRRRIAAVPGGAGSIVVTTLDAQLARTALVTERIAMVLVGVFTATALVLGVLGLYGAMTDAARRRRRDMALCLALGAQGWRLTRQLVAEGLRLAAAGAAFGMLAAVLLSRWLARLAPTDGELTPWVWIAAPLVLMAAVAIASVIPVRRALKVDPLTIMRDR